MRQKSVPAKEPATQVVKNIRRATRRHFSAEDKITIAFEVGPMPDGCWRTMNTKHPPRRSPVSTITGDLPFKALAVISAAHPQLCIAT